MQIVQYEDGVYTDQYKFEHKCRYVVAKLIVEKTDEFFEWDYYTEKIQDYVWVTADGRRFRKHTQTDYGPCDMPFEELDVDERVNFYRYNNERVYFGLYPIIDELENDV